MNTIKTRKEIHIEEVLIKKLKLISAFQNKSVKALMEQAVIEFVQKKEAEAFEQLSDEQKEDLGLFLAMQESKEEYISRDDFYKEIDQLLEE